MGAISEAAATLPLDTLEIAASGLASPVSDHPTGALLNRQANPWTPAQEFRETLVRDALMHDRGLAVIVRDGTGQVRELHRLLPGTVSIELDQLSAEPHYRVSASPASQTAVGGTLHFKDVIDLRCPVGMDGVTCHSPFRDCREAIGLALALEKHGAKLFANGGRPSGILKLAGKYGSDALKKAKAAWQAATAGDNAGGTAVLGEGDDFKPLAFSSVDSQFAELRAFQIIEIARAFRINPILLGDMGRATFSNSSEIFRQFLTLTLRPWLTRIEQELALKLLNDDERGHLSFAHDVDDLSLPGLKDRAAAYGQLVGVVYTPNEIRRWEGLPPHKDGNKLESPHVQSPGKTPADPAPTDPSANNE